MARNLMPELAIQELVASRTRLGARIDIPKNDAPEENLWRDGVEYFDGDDERFSNRRPADKLLNKIFGKPGKWVRYFGPQ